MSALAGISKSVAVLFALVAFFCFAFPIISVFGRTYEGGPMVLTAGFFGGAFAVVALILYGCYRYTLGEPGSSMVLGVVWCFVVLAGLSGSAVAARIIWAFAR